jgi:rhodanese-related sulfurtransferase
MVMTSPHAHANGSVRTLCPELLLQELRSGVPVFIVDVRKRAEVRACGAISGSRLFPLHHLAARVDELAEHRCGPIVVVSQKEEQSRTAVAILTLAGFNEVLALEGGFARWLELGYPVESRRQESCTVGESR